MKTYQIRITSCYNGANTFSTIEARNIHEATKVCKELERRFKQLGDSTRIIIIGE